MTDPAPLIDALDRRVARREERRHFFRTALGAAAVGTAGLIWASEAGAQTAPSDADVLNFALNLEYLEANFYAFAVTGQPIAASLQTGTGRQGAATGGHAVPWSDPIVQRYATEIAADEAAHVAFLRSALGTASAIAQPAIDLSVSATSAFSKAMTAAGVISAGQTFDQFGSDANFLLAAFLFEDVGVTAYKGASPLIGNKTYLEAAAGILAVEAYHAALIRETLYNKGIATPTLVTGADGISKARDTLDGGQVLDVGLSPTTTTTSVTNSDGTTTTTSTVFASIVPADANAIAYSRSTGQVLNIVYLTSGAASAGGFFPAGVNGAITTSNAN